MSYNGVYLLAGYPQQQLWEDCLVRALNSGFDFVEIGLPYSDPLADGKVIWQAGQQVLRQRIMGIDQALAPLTDWRSPLPCYLMCYANPLLRYGLEEFCQHYQGLLAGVIVPDLPQTMHPFFRQRGFSLPLVPFVTPESEPEDLARLAGADFVYLVSTRGITGSKVDFGHPQLLRFIADSKAALPGSKVVLGFGVRSRADTKQIVQHADGFIVGSQAVSRQGQPEEFSRYLASLLHD